MAKISPEQHPAGTRVIATRNPFGYDSDMFEAIIEEWSPKGLVKIKGQWAEPPHLVEVLPPKTGRDDDD